MQQEENFNAYASDPDEVAAIPQPSRAPVLLGLLGAAAFVVGFGILHWTKPALIVEEARPAPPVDEPRVPAPALAKGPAPAPESVAPPPSWQNDFATFGKLYRETMIRDPERCEREFNDQRVCWQLEYRGLRESAGELALEFAKTEGPLGKHGGLRSPYATFHPIPAERGRWEDLPRGTLVTITGRIDLAGKSWVTDTTTGSRHPGPARIVDVVLADSTLPPVTPPVAATTAPPPVAPSTAVAEAPTPESAVGRPTRTLPDLSAAPKLSEDEQRLMRSRELVSFLCAKRDAWFLEGSPLQAAQVGRILMRSPAPLSPAQRRELASITSSKDPWLTKVERLANLEPLIYPLCCGYRDQLAIKDVEAKFGPPDRKEPGNLIPSVSGHWYDYGSVRLGVWKEGRIMLAEINGHAWLEEQQAASPNR